MERLDLENLSGANTHVCSHLCLAILTYRYIRTIDLITSESMI